MKNPEKGCAEGKLRETNESVCSVDGCRGKRAFKGHNTSAWPVRGQVMQGEHQVDDSTLLCPGVLASVSQAGRNPTRQGFIKFTTSMASEGKWMEGRRSRKPVRKCLESCKQGVMGQGKNSGDGEEGLT